MSEAERKGTILVVDDEEAIRRTLAEILEDEGYDVVAVDTGEAGVDSAVEVAPDAVFLDIWLPGMDGIEALRALRERGYRGSVIMISGHGTIETAVRATKLGAYDFIEKPLSLDRVLLVTANAIRHARLERQNRALRGELLREAEFLGESQEIERLRLELAAATEGRPIMLYGEKGSGRRLAARWVTLHGLRPEGPFLDVQASALSRERLIRTLYGDTARPAAEPGRLSIADEGTLYIENADMLPASVQASLVRGLREGAFPVPGNRRLVRADPLVIVSLADDPIELTRRGQLSDDFLGAFPHQVKIPSLRERKEDLPELVERFLDDLCREYGRDRLKLTPEAFAVLLDYSWPGNVRELQRVLERLVLLAGRPLVGREDLPAHLTGKSEPRREGLSDTLLRFERGWLLQSLREVDGDVGRAAARLGVDEQEFRARLTRFGIDPESAP